MIFLLEYYYAYNNYYYIIHKILINSWENSNFTATEAATGRCHRGFRCSRGDAGGRPPWYPQWRALASAQLRQLVTELALISGAISGAISNYDRMFNLLN